MKTKTVLALLCLVLGAILALTSFHPSSKNKKSKYIYQTSNIDKNIVLVDPVTKIHCQNTEVSNLSYRTFLKDLKQEGRDSLYQQCRYDSTGWATHLKNAFNAPMVKNYHWHPAYDHYPVVNISHQAAEEYCKWLTNHYNNQKKRKFKKVVFYLPSELEWIHAAYAFSDGKLPWYGDKPYTQDGSYMTNIKHRMLGQTNCVILDKDVNKEKIQKKESLTEVTKDKEIQIGEFVDYTLDGGFHTIIIGHYLSNRLGLYDMIGNVAEMTDRKGIAKGGHWNSFIEECYIDKHTLYKSANPFTGFRVFMKVVEE